MSWIRFSPPTTLPCFLLIGLALLAPTSARSEDAPPWGFVEAADLEMTAWPGDPDATAAVLSDIGEVHFTGDFELVFTRHRRVKILSEAAYDDWGTVKIPYYAKGGSQKVESVEGITSWRETDGSNANTPLDTGSLFDEDVNRSVRQVRFTMPALRPGCVIEYRYTIRSRGGTFLKSWEFGTTQPTRWSQFVATIPDNLEYIMVKQGLVSFVSEKRDKVGWPSRLDGFERALKFNIDLTRHTWVMKDVAAIRREPFITTAEDYIPRVQFQLARWGWPDYGSVDYIKDWKTVAEDYVAGMGSCGAAEGVAKKLAGHLTDPREKMEVIYQYVRRTIAWNRGSSSSPDLCQAFKARKGSTDEIAAILAGMLRKVGLEVHPLLVSTRGNGRPVPSYPLVTQFNRILTLVVIGDVEYVLDASDPLRPIDLLPLAALSESGFVADPEDPRWMDIPPGATRTETVVRARITEQGAISGVLESRDTGYAALETRQKLREETEKQYLDRVWLPRFTTGTLDSARIAHKDSADVPLLTTIHFSGSGTAGESSGRIYFEPVLVKAVSENPFRNPRRVLPIDFGYTTERTYSMTIDLPEGYALETVPPDVTIDLPQGGGRVHRRIESGPGEIRVFREVVLARPRYPAANAAILRDCYERLLALDSEPIVLVQRPATAGENRE